MAPMFCSGMGGSDHHRCSHVGSRKIPHEKEDDALLANDLNALTMEERNKVYEEIHGVNVIEEETPDLIQERILAVKAELGKFPVSKRRAFDRACFLKPTLAENDKLFLLFLRAVRFDHVAAARNICLHYDHKLELFGEAKLPKKITLDDLDEDDLAVFQTGSYIILPHRDRSGRQPQLIDLTRIQYKSWQNQVRYTWYNCFNVLLEDEEPQKNGVVDVLNFVDMNGIPEQLLNYVRDSHHILNAMPVRSCGFHICYNSKLVRPFLSFLHMVTPKHRKLRERLHFGSRMEVEYELSTFGIAMQDTDHPLDPFGKEFIKKFLAKRRQIEQEELQQQREREERTGIILHPGHIDVLCGRGKPYQDFPGNLRLGKIVDEHVEQYLKTKERLAKTMIAIGIVQKVLDSGGRFLSRRDDGWEVADAKVARGKISQALRVRTLKKVRGEGPAPIHADPGDSILSRDSKRARIEDYMDRSGDDEEDDLSEFAMLPLVEGSVLE